VNPGHHGAGHLRQKDFVDYEFRRERSPTDSLVIFVYCASR